MKKSFILGFLIASFMVNFAFAGGSITGTLQGHSAGVGYDYYTIVGSSANYSLPGNTVFEGGAVNGTLYNCTYTGTLNAPTAADCKVKTAVVKGKLKKNLIGYNDIVDINDSTAVLAKLPTNTTFSGDQIEGEYYLCNFTGTLPDVTTAACSLNSSASATPNSGYRLFPKLLCIGDDALVCWLGAVWRFAQVAILVLAVAAMVVAGIIYMTSAGNPKQIAMAKKIIIGALSGVAVMILGRFFLVNIIGVDWIW